MDERSEGSSLTVTHKIYFDISTFRHFDISFKLTKLLRYFDTSIFRNFGFWTFRFSAKSINSVNSVNLEIFVQRNFGEVYFRVIIRKDITSPVVLYYDLMISFSEDAYLIQTSK